MLHFVQHDNEIRGNFGYEVVTLSRSERSLVPKAEILCSLFFVLRKSSKPPEVGLALFHKRLAALLGFFGKIVQQCRVASELLEASRAIGIGVDRGLEEADRHWALLQDL